MEAVFLRLFNMSIAASFMILAVVLLRALFKKAPKALRPVLWALVGIRLICPFSFESALSLIPSAQTIPDSVLSEPSFSVQTGFEGVDTRVNAELASRYYEGVTVPTNTGLHITSLLAVIWVIGILALAIYAAVSFVRLRRQTAESIKYAENIYLCDRIPSPFILGIVKPHIFLPSSINEADIPYVLAHEQAHLKRRDHLWKPLGFVLLSIYWFNPLIWVAYILLCRDIELACDEKVIKSMGTECKKPYADALINCSVSQRKISACPVAFGETDVKGRIQSVLKYKKPAFWVILVAVLTCVAVAVCFLTVPKGVQLIELGAVNSEPQSVTVVMEGDAYEIPRRSIPFVRNFFNQVSVSRTPITHRRDERDKTNTVIFHFDSGDICYYFNKDCTELWVDDTIKPSLTHRVKDPLAVRQFFENRENDFLPAELEGLSLQATDADFSSDPPYLEIEWINTTKQDLVFGESYCIYRENNGTWERIEFREGYGVFDAVGILLHANSSRTHTYRFWGLDMAHPGKYRLESDCFKDIADGDTDYRQEYMVHFDFELVENADGGLSCKSLTTGVDAEQLYIYKDSVDPMAPRFSLSPSTNQFQFSYSAFSSYFPVGTYELTADTLTLRTDDGENVYVFHAQENGFVFDAAESSKIPQYKYSGNSKETQSPVPDGAVFTWMPSV